MSKAGPAFDPVAHIPPLSEEALEHAVDAAYREMRRQDQLARAGKFGGTHVMPGGTDLERNAVLGEEVSEALDEVPWALALAAARGRVDIEVCKAITAGGQQRRESLEKELVQVAAVALAWIAAIHDGRDA